MHSGFLAHMAESSLARARAARARTPERALRARCRDLAPAPELAFAGFGVLAEIKWRSPSGGAIRDPGHDPVGAAVARARGYAQGGAAAVSVLTEPDAFGGSLEQLAAVSAALTAESAPARIPTMRKDFLVDPYQVWEARAAGARLALVVVVLVDDQRLAELREASREAGIRLLEEAFDGCDLARVEGFVGVNARDLETLEVDTGRLLRLASRIPPGSIAVAESGIASPADAARAARLGYRAALVGSALMRTSDPAALVAELTAAGRDSIRRSA